MSTATEAHTQAHAAGQIGYGGFLLGGLQLALPMSALREVLPCGPLTDLPCPAACVVGGFDLRGVLVPVVDLRLVLGRTATAIASPSVIVMVHEGRILGLLSDGVTGVFSALLDSVSRNSVSGETLPLASGSLRRADDGTLVSVLSPAALAALPQVPMVQDPEPRRQRLNDDAHVDGDAAAAADDAAVPLVLLRCGRIALAIDAIGVHTTLSDPRIEPSVLAQGHCRGVIDYAGSKIAAIDLLALCGLGRLADGAAQQAFVMRVGSGRVAFLVERVVDVVRTPLRDVIALPACALPEPALFAGVLPAAAAPRDDDPAATSAYFVLNSGALGAHAEVQALASTNTPGSSAALDMAGTSAGLHGNGLRNMLTYALAGETATPLDQVSEILPYRSEIAVFAPGSRVLGLLVNRGRSIPVLCLSQLVMGESAPATDASSVLVVESQGELMGFVVPGLKAIEAAHWEPELPSLTPGAGDTGRSRKLAQLGSGPAERMVPVLDLRRIAAGLQARPGAGA